MIQNEDFLLAKSYYWRFMSVIENRCSEKRQERSGIISFLKNKEVNGLVVCPASQQFSVKTIKRYFCQNVLELSWREDISIKQYNEFFEEDEFTKKNGISISSMLEIIDVEKNMEIYSKIVSFLGEDSVLQGWTPCVLLGKLRKLCYETYIEYISAEVNFDSEESLRNKKKCYLNFISAFVLFHIFWEEMSMTEYSHYAEDFSDEVKYSAGPNVRSLSEMPKLKNALILNMMCVDIKRYYLLPLIALWGIVICTEFLSLRELSIKSSFSKKYDTRKILMLFGDDVFRNMVLFAGELEKNNTSKYKQFDAQVQETDLVQKLFGNQENLSIVRNDISTYLEWIKDNLNEEYLIPPAMPEMRMTFYMLPNGIKLMEEKLCELEQKGDSSIQLLS